MLARLGIGARLFIAFLGIVALSLSSGVAGWHILRVISDAQTRIIGEGLPAIAAAQRTAEFSARLVATAPSLVAARDEASRAEQEFQVTSLAAHLRKSVTDAGLSSLDPQSLTKLSQTVDVLLSNLSAQNRLVQQRLQLREDFERRAEHAISAASGIVDVSETLVSNASAAASAVVSNLYDLIDDTSRHGEAYEALDRLIEQDIYLLDRMWELRLRSSQIGLITNRLIRAIDRREVSEIVTAFEDHLRVLRRRVASIDDPVRRTQAAGFLAVLEGASGRSPVSTSLFGDRVRLLAIGDELETLAADNRNLSATLNLVVQDVMRNSETFARVTSAQAERAVNAGFYVLVLTSLIAVAISGLIVWLYVERGVVRRLAGLAHAMKRLTDGDLDVEVAPEGTRELQALSDAVVAFRDGSRQRLALEQERERTNEELRQHREELQKLVSIRTAELQREVENHAAARNRAEAASRAKSDFLATMSHEIRTPMTGMLGMLRLLKEEELSPGQFRQVSVASSSGNALLGILNSILDYSKIESGTVAPDPEDFDLRELLRGVVDSMRPAAEEKNLKLSLVIGKPLPPRLHGDAGKLRQIIFNLLSNAIKFTAKGRVRIEATRSGPDSGQRLRIAVTDTGIGIPQQEYERIFDSFTQTDVSITRHYGGTGLGLSISRGLAQVLGGNLSVTSEHGRGSCFVLDVPMPDSIAPAPRKVRRKHAVPLASLRILIVDDDAATREVARLFLVNLGHQPTAVADGSQALAAFGAIAPELVLMDISLPGFDGISAAAQLRALAGTGPLPIIAMSAHVFKSEIDHYLASGMNAFIAKPLSPEALAEAIASVTAFGPLATARSVLDVASVKHDLSNLGPEMMRKVIRIASETLPAQFKSMRLALETGDRKTLLQRAHAAYSSASAAGFADLCGKLRELEAAPATARKQALLTIITSCERLLAQSLAEVRVLTGHEDIKTPRKGSPRRARSR